jgi:hypothetical protein
MRRNWEGRDAKACLIFEKVRRVSDHVKHGTISFYHLLMLTLTKDLDPNSELFREDVDHLNLRLRDE